MIRIDFLNSIRHLKLDVYWSLGDEDDGTPVCSSLRLLAVVRTDDHPYRYSCVLVLMKSRILGWYLVSPSVLFGLTSHPVIQINQVAGSAVDSEAVTASDSVTAVYIEQVEDRLLTVSLPFVISYCFRS